MRVFSLRGARVRGDDSSYQSNGGFYVPPVVFLQQIRCVDVISGFPCVVTLRVSSPFDQILQGMTAPKVPVVLDGLHFVFHCSFDNVWWWSGEVQSMLCHFMIG
jgi:hypothetical protein